MNDLYPALVAGVVAVIFELVEMFFRKMCGQKKTSLAGRGVFVKTCDALGHPPLKFHKFVHYLFLPIRFIILAITFSDFIAHFQHYDTLGFLVTLISVVLPCVMIIVAFVGFFKWTPYSLFSLFAYFFLDVILGLYVLISSLRYFPEEAPSSIGRFCGIAVVSALICSYYWKHRNSFLHKSSKIPTLNFVNEKIDATAVEKVEFTSNSDKVMDMPTADVNNDVAIKYCHKCGKKLLPESIYCSYCGVKVNGLEG